MNRLISWLYVILILIISISSGIMYHESRHAKIFNEYNCSNHYEFFPKIQTVANCSSANLSINQYDEMDLKHYKIEGFQSNCILFLISVIIFSLLYFPIFGKHLYIR